MRIAYVVTRADAVGGATVHVVEMARAMLNRGHAVAVFVGGEGPAARRLAESGAPVRGLRFMRRQVRPDRDLPALLELTAALRGFRPDLVSTHTAKAGWIGRAASARLGVPSIYTPHGLPVGDRIPGLRAAFFRTAERIAGRWARAVVCVCEHERRLALAHRLAPPRRLLVVHNGAREIPEELRSDPGANPVRIVSVARFEAPKDHRTLLCALARLRSLDWELELVGDGPLESSSRALAASLGIARNVRFAGYRQDVAAVLGRAQVFVLSSRSEALPRSVLEAMRAGLPVVATDVGGLPEMIAHGVNGMLTPRGNHEALAAALASLIVDAGSRLRLGASARATYETRFRLEFMIEKTAAIYEKVLGDGGFIAANA
jgi:glycosyltransferase involved in cell wall biosynthesis